MFNFKTRKQKEIIKKLDKKIEEIIDIIEDAQINNITNHIQCYKQIEYARYIKDIIKHPDRWWWL